MINIILYQMHEVWWARFAIGLCEDFPSLNHEDRQLVARWWKYSSNHYWKLFHSNAQAVDRFCQGIYIGPGSNQSLIVCVNVSRDEMIPRILFNSDIIIRTCWEIQRRKKSSGTMLSQQILMRTWSGTILTGSKVKNRSLEAQMLVCVSVCPSHLLQL